MVLQKNTQRRRAINSKRQVVIREEMPAQFERITLEFNTLYNELLASIRDRRTGNAQEQLIRLYRLYRKISRKNLKKEEMHLLEKRIKDVASLVPSSGPPKIILPLVLIAGIFGFLLFFGPEIAGLAGSELREISFNPGISVSNYNVHYGFNLEAAPSSIRISGRVSSPVKTIARVFAAREGPDYLVAEFNLDENTVMFENECAETCSMAGFGSSSVVLIVEAENAMLEITDIAYSTAGNS